MKLGTPFDPEILLERNVHKEATSKMFIMVLFIIEKKSELDTTSMPTSRGAVNKLWYIDTIWDAMQELKRMG